MIPSRLMFSLSIMCILWWSVPGVLEPAAAVTLATPDAQEAALPVVTAPDATEAVEQFAADLADYLGRMSGARFDQTTGDGTRGIAVGVATDFPELGLADAFDLDDPMRGDAYLLRSHAGGLCVIGASEAAVGHAVWDLLHRLGHRQYFPHEAWEIVPEHDGLAIEVDEMVRPDYVTRRIWLQWGAGPWTHEQYQRWGVRNRIPGAFTLYDHHMYGEVINTKKEIFEAHPEYLGLSGDQRVRSKFCVSNPAVRDVVADFVVGWFEKNSDAPAASIEPSDGAHWCECEDCAKLGSITNQAVLLANHVAEQVEQRVEGERYLGMLAYFRHAHPPTIRVHPRVIVSATTGLRHTPLTLEEALAGWREQGAEHLGVYVYYSVGQWWRDQPGRPTASDTREVAGAIRRWHDLGLRFFSAESGDNWGPNGLGYYIASRALWDVDVADRVDTITEEFVTQCFGDAAEPMRRFYDLIDGRHKETQRPDLLGQMYRLLDEAWGQASDPAVKQRLTQLIAYTRYVELFRQYAQAEGDARQEAFENMMRHVYRIRHTGMVHTWALQTLATNDKNITWPAEAQLRAKEADNPWISDEPIRDDEVAGLLATGVEAHPVLPFDDVTFSTDLVPAGPLGLAEVEPLRIYQLNRWDQPYYVWVPEGHRELQFKFGGTNRTLRLYAMDAGGTVTDRLEVNRPVDANVIPETDDYAMTLRTEHAGLHKLVVSEGTGGVGLNWEDMRVVLPLGQRSWYGVQSGYFYVPKGTDVIAGDVGAAGKVIDPRGQVQFEKKYDPKTPVSDADRKTFVVEVPEGMDGQLWTLKDFMGRWYLRTVPPYLARSADEMLLPREVVEKDME